MNNIYEQDHFSALLTNLNSHFTLVVGGCCVEFLMCCWDILVFTVEEGLYLHTHSDENMSMSGQFTCK